jgi:hypothetical protein
VSRHAVIVTLYRRRRRRPASVSDRRDEDTYQVWLFLDLSLAEGAGAVPGSVVGPVPGADAEGLRERLWQAVAESVADPVEEMLWKIADGSSQEQVSGLIADLPDSVKTQARRLLEGPAAAAGVPALAAVPTSAIVTSVLLDPILEPVEDGLHALEVVGVVIGMAIGLHPLVITCLEHLAFDQVGSALTTAIKHMMKSDLRQSAAVSAPSVIPAIASYRGDSNDRIPVGKGSPLSSDTQELIKAGKELGSMSASDLGQESELAADIGSAAEGARDLSSGVNLSQI